MNVTIGAGEPLAVGGARPARRGADVHARRALALGRLLAASSVAAA